MNALLKLTGSLIAALVCVMNSFAQVEREETFTPHHSIGMVLSHTLAFQGVDEQGNRKTLNLPSWGLDYNYNFHPKWGIGLHTDIIVEKFTVEKIKEDGSKGELIERSYPVAPALVGMFNPSKHWAFLLGAGGEFASDGNYFLNRIGIDYGVEIPKNWEVSVNLAWDIKWHAYDSWTIGIGISKLLTPNKKD